MDKTTQTLVTYASKYGATKEIAEHISECLNLGGLTTELVAVDQIDSLENYDFIVLGTAIYMGQWRKDAIRFLKRYRHILKEKKLWIFASGPTGEGEAEELVEGWKYPRSLKKDLEELQALEIKLFHGFIDMEKMSFFDRWIIKNVKAEVGDFRNWDEIANWANEILVSCQQQESL